MKLTYLLIVILSAVIAPVVWAYPVEDSPVDEHVNGEGGWYVPQLDGSFVWMTEEEAQAEAHKHKPQSRAKEAKYYLYTQKNRYEPQIIEPGVESIKNSNFNAKNPTRFIIHGWQNNYKSDVNIFLRDALLDTGDYNVISVDWSRNAESINYPSASYKVIGVGKQVAQFVDFLNEQFGMSFKTLQCYGHSLGSHVCGFVGKNVKRGRINTIYGMDVASPLYTYSHINDRLHTSDAEYVESIHTNGGSLGFLEPIGQAAFYPNGGKSQPGCGIDMTGSCSHSRSFEYLAEAIRFHNFPTIPCNTYKQASKKKCGNVFSETIMGDPANIAQDLNGIFYVPIKSKKAPFGFL